MISANQLSVFGAVADLCNELSEDLRASGETWSDGDSYWPFYCRNSYQCTATGKPCARIQTKNRTIPRRPEIIQIMLWWRVLKLVEIGQYFYTLDTEEGLHMQHLCREYTDASKWKRDSCERMDSKEYENQPSLEHKSSLSRWSIQYRSSGPISVSRQYCLLG